MKKFLFLLAVAILLWPFNSWADPTYLCTKRAPGVKMLEEKYGEVPIWTGMSAKGALVELYQSPGADNTWTFVVTPPPGHMSCPILGGTTGVVDPPEPGTDT